MMLNRLLIMPGVDDPNAEHWGQFVLAHAEAQRVYGVARESHNEHIRNTLKHSTCSHKWWETLKDCSIFGVKPSIPALMGPEVVWWWLLLRKPHSWALSLTTSNVMSSLSLLCIVSLSLGAILWPSKLVSSYVCFSILICMGLLIIWVFPLFLKKVADIITPKLSIIFCKLIHLGLFPECWWSAYITAIPKGAPSPDRENY